MKIAIMSRKAELYSTSRLKEEAERNGHEVSIVNPLFCSMNISHEEPNVFYRGTPLPFFDAIIPRIGASVTFYGSAVLRQFEMMGIFTLNDSVSINRSRDKLRSLQIMSRKKIPMPVTGFSHTARKSYDLIDLVGGAPVILKLLEGTQGKGVVMAPTRKAAESVIGAFQNLNANFIVQEFIKEAGGADFRSFVIGEKVVATIKRQGQEGEFRSNLHLGGTATQAKISPYERKMVVDAARAMGLKVAGVDFVRSDKGAMVLEVNSSPGLEGIEKYTGKNIAGKIIHFIEENAKPDIKRHGVRG